MPRASLIELFTRKIRKINRQDKVYSNGVDNLYPQRVESIINNSVTAKLAVDKMCSYLLGMGFEGDINDRVLNPKKNLTAYDILNRVVKDTSRQKGAYIHINYDVDGTPNYVDVLKFKNCRVAEEDDFDYSGFVWHAKDWENENVLLERSKKNKSWFYPYNPDINVINAQRRADAPKDASPEELIKNYRGQVLFFNLEEDSIYPNAWIDPAYNDADTEYHISVFRNDRVKNGFMGANIIVLPEGEDENQALVTDEDLKNLLGSDNASNILKLEVKAEGDKKLEDYIHVETVKSEVNTDQFKYDEEKIEENILACYKIPRVLVKSSDSSLFGTSGELLKQAQVTFQSETERERMAIEKLFNKIFKKTGEEFEIVKLIDEETAQTNTEDAAVIDTEE